jgi:uncharacterized membrane protein
VIFGVAQLFANYLLAKQLFERRTALVTVCLSVFWEVLVAYSQEYRLYALFLLLITLASYLLLFSAKSRVVPKLSVMCVI